MRRKIKITPELLKQIEREGYQVTRKAEDMVRKTFVVDRELLTDFVKVRSKLGLKVQDAVDQALREWVRRHGK